MPLGLGRTAPSPKTLWYESPTEQTSQQAAGGWCHPAQPKENTLEWQCFPDTMKRSCESEVIVEVRGHRVPKGLPEPPMSHGQYLLGSGLPRVWRKSPLSHSGWCSHCRRGSHWQMVVMVKTGMVSYAGLCTGPQQSLQEDSMRHD